MGSRISGKILKLEKSGVFPKLHVYLGGEAGIFLRKDSLLSLLCRVLKKRVD